MKSSYRQCENSARDLEITFRVNELRQSIQKQSNGLLFIPEPTPAKEEGLDEEEAKLVINFSARCPIDRGVNFDWDLEHLRPPPDDLVDDTTTWSPLAPPKYVLLEEALKSWIGASPPSIGAGITTEVIGSRNRCWSIFLHSCSGGRGPPLETGQLCPEKKKFLLKKISGLASPSLPPLQTPVVVSGDMEPDSRDECPVDEDGEREGDGGFSSFIASSSSPNKPLLHKVVYILFFLSLQHFQIF